MRGLRIFAGLLAAVGLAAWALGTVPFWAGAVAAASGALVLSATGGLSRDGVVLAVMGTAAVGWLAGTIPGGVALILVLGAVAASRAWQPVGREPR